MTATADYSDGKVPKNETAFPLCRAMDSLWNYYYYYSLLLLCHLSLVLYFWISHIYCVSHQYVRLLLIHSGLSLGLVAFGLGFIALGLGLDLVASASYTSGLINIPGRSITKNNKILHRIKRA